MLTTSVHDAMLNFQFEVLEKEIKNHYIYTRKVNIPMLQITQSVYRIQDSISNSFKIRGGFSKS